MAGSPTYTTTRAPTLTDSGRGSFADAPTCLMNRASSLGSEHKGYIMTVLEEQVGWLYRILDQEGNHEKNKGSQSD